MKNTIQKTLPTLALFALFAIMAFLSAPAFAQTPLERLLKSRGYELPYTISYDDFYETAYDEGMVDIEQMLAEHDVEILGQGDSRYIRRTDLLRICGKDCSYHDGWGIFLSNFAVQTHRR